MTYRIPNNFTSHLLDENRFYLWGFDICEIKAENSPKITNWDTFECPEGVQVILVDYRRRRVVPRGYNLREKLMDDDADQSGQLFFLLELVGAEISIGNYFEGP